MPTPPTFTSGSVLTAAQMNAVGLWLVKSQVVGNGVTSQAVTNCFTSDFDSYKVIYDGGAASTTCDLTLKLGSSTTGYYGFLQYGAYTANTVYGYGINNAGAFGYFGGGDGNYCWGACELHQPNLAKHTMFTSQSNGSAINFWTCMMRHAVATAYTDLTIAPTSGTITGGTIYVYGYRK